MLEFAVRVIEARASRVVLDATKNVAPIIVPVAVRRRTDADESNQAPSPALRGGVWTSIGENAADLTAKSGTSDKGSYQM
ncbi:hypothetical protein KTD26_31090 [Burkholderia multivorans]|uniref:hypothetical protein n=1 Tax=Burkholderia multivorans TaxID=87883 RepID=UPI001C245771|nr:hypothetical protein [Burkholderia multivorans]MBU9146956.1 hypothetical protein [Burkholderia multivorans]